MTRGPAESETHPESLPEASASGDGRAPPTCLSDNEFFSYNEIPLVLTAGICGAVFRKVWWVFKERHLAESRGPTAGLVH